MRPDRSDGEPEVQLEETRPQREHQVGGWLGQLQIDPLRSVDTAEPSSRLSSPHRQAALSESHGEAVEAQHDAL